ncbi:GTPase [Thermostichus sp. MS-CIW-25]
MESFKGCFLPLLSATAMARRNTLQDDLNYQQAKRSLRQWVAQLDLRPQEVAGLEGELESLQALLDKLETEVIHIAAFGLVGRGKSSLLNALLGEPVFETGPTHGITRTQQAATWNISWETRPQSSFSGTSLQGSRLPPSSVQSVQVAHWQGSRLELIDTPGLDEVDGEERARLAQEVAQRADLILFVVCGDLTRVEFEALATLREAGKPMLLVFNKIDQYPEADRQAIYDKIRNERVRQLLSPNEIVMVAASPRVPRLVQRPDGSFAAQMEVGSPQVDELRQKILEVLHREGRSLLALNALLFADRVNQQVIERKLQTRAQQAQDLIASAARTKALAVALNPITLLDTLGGLAIDVTLILRLARLYGWPMSTAGATQLLQKIILSMLSLGAGEWVALLGLGSLKTLLGGFSLGAYGSVALTQAVLAGFSCYAIGESARRYLAQGASWGPEGPKAAIAQILADLDEASITARLREEIRHKIGFAFP